MKKRKLEKSEIGEVVKKIARFEIKHQEEVAAGLTLSAESTNKVLVELYKWIEA